MVNIITIFPSGSLRIFKSMKYAAVDKKIITITSAINRLIFWCP